MATPVTAAPDLPSGVSFSTMTVAIGGTPSIEFAKTSFTITATDSANSPQTASYTVDIQVSPSTKAPQVSITVGSGVTEGGDATYTVTASPAPSSPLSVRVSVTQQGDFGTATESRTVTIPTSGSASVTASTTNDGADEPDGSVSVRVDAGHGYTVSSAQGSASVSVLDNDDPLTPDVPQVSLVGDASITEGEYPGFLEFHVELSRASEEDVTVRYEVRPDTAEPHLDYSGGYGRVVVYVGRTQASLIVRVRDDTGREAHEETLSVVLTEAEGAVIAPDEHTATGTIVAND